MREAEEVRTKNGRPEAASLAATLAASLPLLASFAASLLYVHAHGVNVFYADEWNLVPLIRKDFHGALGIAELFVRHNEHVYLFPWGLTLLLGRITGYDTVPLMYLVCFCLLVTALAVFWVYSKGVGRSSLALLLFAPVLPLLFSLRQFENMLWGNQITFAFAQTFSVLALCLLSAIEDHRPRRNLLILSLAVLCATVASCSAAPGLLAWPSGLLLLLFAFGMRSFQMYLAAAWVFFGGIVWCGYLAGFDTAGAAPAPSFVLGQPVTGAKYLLTLSGSSLFWGEATALVAGVLLVLVAAASLALALALGKVGENAFWLSLGAFSLMSLALITAGRSGFGEAVFAQAMLSRYTTFSIVGVVGFYGLLSNLALNARSRIAAVVLCVLLATALAGGLRSYQFGLEAGRIVEDSRHQAARILLAHETEPPAAFTIFGHDPTKVRTYARFLDKHDYGPFAEGASGSEE